MGLLMTLVSAHTKIGHDSKGIGPFLDKKAAKETFKDRHFTDAMMDLAKLAGGVPDDRGIQAFLGRERRSKRKRSFRRTSRR